MSAAAFLARWESGETPVREEFADGRLASWTEAGGPVARRRAFPAPPIADAERWLRRLESDGAPLVAMNNARRLAEGALCVVTGQQCGLGLGPLFTLWKSLGALRHAQAVERETGHPCVPVFWIASDDHDLAEISELRWLDREGTPRRDAIAAEFLRSGAPAHAAAIDRDTAGRLLTAFRDSTRETEFRPRLLEALEAALLTGGATFESAFESLLLRWLGPLGIVPVRARDPWVRSAAARLALRELEHPRESARVLKSQYERYHEQFGLSPIHRSGDEFNFFVEFPSPEGIVRARVDWEDEGGTSLLARHAGTRETLASWSVEELRRLIETEPERLSPNAALRPLVQDAALNTVAYVAGPSEFVYHGQLGPLYRAFGICRPAVLPRPSVTLVDARTKRTLERAGIGMEAAVRMGDDALAKALRRGDDPAALLPLGDALESSLSLWEQGAAADLQADPAIRSAVAKLREALRQGSARVEERLRESRERRAGTNEAQTRRALDALHPGGEPQERALGPLAPLFLNHGTEVLFGIAESIDPNDWRGQALPI